MHGPTKRAGAVGALEDIPTPSLVAKAVMDYTDHIMLVGAGAKKFALQMGFKEQNLLTEKSRRDWLRFYALAKDGRFGSATAYEGARFAVADSEGARLIPMPFRFSRAERPQMPEVSCRRA